jgi:hypothetical protein
MSFIECLVERDNKDFPGLFHYSLPYVYRNLVRSMYLHGPVITSGHRSELH